MKHLLEFILILWQAPQMLAAWIWLLLRYKYISGYTKRDIYTIYRGTNPGGVTLGDKIFLSDIYHGEYLSLITAHEVGHVKQSRYLGPLYLFVIGIPSLIWASIHRSVAPKKSYYWFYTEKWANKLGGVAVGSDGVLTWEHLVS